MKVTVVGHSLPLGSGGVQPRDGWFNIELHSMNPLGLPLKEASIEI